MLALVTGPVRSGKSRFALRLAAETGKRPLFVATLALDPADPEMADRISRHRAERAGMACVEVDEPRLGLAAIVQAGEPGEVLVVDSLGTWIGGLLTANGCAVPADLAGLAARIEERVDAVLEALAACRSDAIVVAEETGWGVVPPAPLGRVFRDVLGRATARLARRAVPAYLVAAGYAIDLRAVGRPVSD